MTSTGKSELENDLYSMANTLKVYRLPMIVCSVGVVVCVMVFLLMVQNNIHYQERNFNLVSKLEGKLIKARFLEIFTAISDTAKKSEQSFVPGLRRINTDNSTIAQMPEVKSAYLLSLEGKVVINRVMYLQPDSDATQAVTKEIVNSDYMKNIFSQYVYLPTGSTVKILNYRAEGPDNRNNYLIATQAFAKAGKRWALVYFIDMNQLVTQIAQNERKNTDFGANIFLTRKFEDNSFGLIYEYYQDKRIASLDLSDKFSIYRQIGKETFNNETEFEFNRQYFSIIHVPTNKYLSSVVNLNVWLTLLSIIIIIALISYFLFYLITRNLKIQDLVDIRTKELTEATQDLAVKNEELVEINRELEDFTYIVSHDIRSPLINLKGFSDEINMGSEKIKEQLNDPSTPKDVKDKLNKIIDTEIGESIQYINKAVKSLDSMTASILDFSRLGKIETKIEEISTQKIIDEVLARYTHQIKTKNIKIKIGKMPDIYSDYISLREVFSNIIDNAIKYMPAEREGKIEIYGSPMPDSKYVMFTIRDNGAGISNEAKKKVFQILRRATLDKSIPGHGMGMPFVRAILKKLKGRIWFKSVLGKGTTFYFVVPSIYEPQKSS